MTRHLGLTRKLRTVIDGDVAYKFTIEEHSGWCSVTAITMENHRDDSFNVRVADIGWKDVPQNVIEQLREDLKSVNALYVGEVDFTVADSFEGNDEKPTIIK